MVGLKRIHPLLVVAVVLFRGPSRRWVWLRPSEATDRCQRRLDEQSCDALVSADFRQRGNESDRPNEGRAQRNVLFLPAPPVCGSERARPWNQKRHFERPLQTARLHLQPFPHPSAGRSQVTGASCTEAPPTHSTIHRLQRFFKITFKWVKVEMASLS